MDGEGSAEGEGGGGGVINTHMTTQVVMSLSFSGATPRDDEFVKKKKKKKKNWRSRRD